MMSDGNRGSLKDLISLGHTHGVTRSMGQIVGAHHVVDRSEGSHWPIIYTSIPKATCHYARSEYKEGT